MRLLQNFTNAELRSVSGVLDLINCKKAEEVIHEGTKGSCIYLVKKGTLRVNHSVRGKERELAIFHPGDHFGELSFIDQKPRSASIFAIEDSELLVLGAEAFRGLLDDHPRLQLKLMQALLEDLCVKLRSRPDALDFELSDMLPVAIFEMDLKGHITFANRSGLASFGFSDSDFTDGINLFAMLIPADRPRARHNFKSARRSSRNRVSEYSLIRKDDSIVPVVLHCEALKNEGGIFGFRVTLIDITERKQMEESLRQARDELEIRVMERTAELKESEERYALAVRGANDGLWDWNFVTNEIYFSPRWKEMLGIDQDDIPPQPAQWMERIHPDDVHQVKTAIFLHRQGASPHLEVEYRIRHSDGSYRWMLARGLAVFNGGGPPYRMAGSQTDITERKRMEYQLIHDALYDQLTDLPNRVLFMDRLRLALDRARYYTQRGRAYLFALLYIDLDRFKLVNDSFGHIVGDELLSAVSERLRETVHPGDTVARLGGDEFAILLDEIRDSSTPVRVANRIMERFRVPFAIPGTEVFVTASIGIALSSGRNEYEFSSLVESIGMLPAASRKVYERPEEILRDADTAMYRAKTRSTGSYEIFDVDMHARACQIMEKETDLRWALDRKEFHVCYQPIVSLKTGQIAGFEALLRWKHPTHGLIFPSEFISIAEETGLIVPIGLHVLDEACSQVRFWNDHFLSNSPVFISVNVSAKQFLQKDFPNQIDKILENTGLHPRNLHLEITESVMMENLESAFRVLPVFKAMGIELGLDDFGTGYSSLSALHHFPIDSLKIDKSFIHGMSENADNLQIVSTIITLARSLEMTLVAEGVEEAHELAQLRALKCDYAQGFHFCRPLDPHDVESILLMNLQW